MLTNVEVFKCKNFFVAQKCLHFLWIDIKRAYIYEELDKIIVEEARF